MLRETRATDEFDAEDDRGNVYTVVEYQEFIETRAIGQPPEWLSGMKSYRLDDGSPVNYVDADTFKLVIGERLIRRIK